MRPEKMPCFCKAGSVTAGGYREDMQRSSWDAWSGFLWGESDSGDCEMVKHDGHEYDWWAVTFSMVSDLVGCCK